MTSLSLSLSLCLSLTHIHLYQQTYTLCVIFFCFQNVRTSQCDTIRHGKFSWFCTYQLMFNPKWLWGWCTLWYKKVHGRFRYFQFVSQQHSIKSREYVLHKQYHLLKSFLSFFLSSMFLLVLSLSSFSSSSSSSVTKICEQLTHHFFIVHSGH